MLVSGTVGCGKSELSDTVAERAASRGAVVLRAIGTASERDLPLGVLGQLTRSGPAGALPGPAPGPAEAERVEAMQAFCSAVLELSATAPVVICVDDLHHADELSGRYLLHLARHARQAAVLLVLTESVHERRDDPYLGTELLRRPNFVRIRLERLSRGAVAELLAGTGHEGLDPDRCHAVSGGNPLLLRALLEDPEPAPGGAYAQAVLACLQRCGSATAELAGALAVLDGAGSTVAVAAGGTAGGTAALAAGLLGISPASAARGAAALDAAGITDGIRFRHPAARQAVLDRMAPAERLDAHRRAAGLAQHGGAPAPDVARQLLAAQHADEEWALPVLRAAAEQLLAEGDAEGATHCLELAHEAAGDHDQRAELRIRLSAIARRGNPAAAERHLAEPLGAARAGLLPPPRMAPLARLLIAQGRIDEAGEVLDGLVAAVPAPAPAPPAAAGEAHPYGHAHAPDPLDGLTAFPGWGVTRRPGAGVGGLARPRGPAAFWALPEAGQSTVAAADGFLRGASLTDGTLEPIVQAVRALLYLGGPQRAVSWCESYADQAARRAAPGWQAVFAGLHAEALLRQGDLTGAEAMAAATLDAVPASERGASVLLGGIAGTLIRARTAMGRPEGAAAELSRPAPEQLAGSVHGLGYLRARGKYHLATSRFHAALGDFLDAGRLMKRWGLDRPLLLPWRTDAAEALLRLGEAHQAERFIADQLTTRDAADPWVRGISLRVRAELREPKERQALLAKAVDELRKSGDRFELARAFADFGRSLKEGGESARANMVNRRAWHLAQKCGAEALRERILPGHAPKTTARPPGPSAPSAPADPAAPAAPAAVLSESERRVAMLAVNGYTNREIALKLYITVSTVEQHLTRAYRKLHITRRQELPVDIQPRRT